MIKEQDKQKRLEYEAREKAVHDYNQLIYEAEQRGIQIGEQQGEQRGEQKGMERLNKLNALLLQNKRYDDLERSMSDITFQQKLLSEYKI